MDRAIAMKSKKVLLSLLVLLGLGMLGESAWAHPPRARVGVYIGAPAVFWGPGWYPTPWYYQPQPLVVVPQTPPPPPVYIEQQAAPAEQYWYYCGPSQAYYPYVKDCAEEWQRVLPQPEKK